MKVKVLDIYGYGKWINQRFDLDETLQMFYGENEAGKSTLQSFIKSILFGFPRRGANRNNYEPKQSEAYGGRILLEGTEYGSVWVERTSKGLKITDDEDQMLPERTLQNILGGLDEKLFDSFYSFNLQNLQELANVGSEQLNEFFLSIGTVGSDQFLKVARQLQKESDDLYRPRAMKRPLNQLLTDYKKSAQELEETKASVGQYNKLQEQYQKITKEIEQLDEQIQDLESKWLNNENLTTRYEAYLQYQGTKRALDQLVWTPMPEEALDTLNHHLKNNEHLKEETIQLEERLFQLQHQLEQLTRLNWANNHKHKRRQWIEETNQIKDVQNKIEMLQQRIEEQKTTMEQLARRGQFYEDKVENTKEYQKEVEKGLDLQARKKETDQAIESLEMEQQLVFNQRKEQQEHSAALRQQLVRLEHQKQIQEAQLEENTSFTHYTVGGGLVAFGLVLLVIGLIKSSGWLLLLFAALFIVAGGGHLLYIYQNHRQYLTDSMLEDIDRKVSDLHHEEEKYLENAQLLTQQLSEGDTLLEAYQQQLKEIHQKQAAWLESIGFYPTADPQMILTYQPVEQYFEAEDLLKELQKDLEQLEFEVIKWRENLVELLERFPGDDSKTRPLIRHVEEVEASLVKEVLAAERLEEKMSTSNQRLAQIKRQMDENDSVIHSLYNETKSANERIFRQKVADNQRIDELNRSLSLYEEQIKGYEEELKAIETKQALIAQRRSLEDQMNELKQTRSPLQSEQATLAVQIEQLERDGTYQEKIQALENKKSDIKAMIFEWGQKRIAMELINETLRGGIDNPLLEMNELADRIFETLSQGRYVKINLNKNGVKVRQFSDVLFEPHELSQGTLEQLYVALRLAFVMSARHMVKMPLIIDDAFVNFDETRRRAVYQLLKEMSVKQQILFFTFDPLAKEVLSDDKIIDLKVDQEPLEREG